MAIDVDLEVHEQRLGVEHVEVFVIVGDLPWEEFLAYETNQLPEESGRMKGPSPLVTSLSGNHGARRLRSCRGAKSLDSAVRHDGAYLVPKRTTTRPVLRTTDHC
jgi:hypothetical protein